MSNIRHIAHPLIPPNYAEINLEERNHTAFFSPHSVTRTHNGSSGSEVRIKGNAIPTK